VLSSFSAGGAERVFWLLCQAFDKSKFDVIVVLLSAKENAFSLDLPGVRIVDLKTIKASYSFFELLRLVRKEKPYAVYSTGGQINSLVSFVSNFASVPFLIARGTNIPGERTKYVSLKSRILSKLGTFTFHKFNYIICQSEEMLVSWKAKHKVKSKKLIVIPNPILNPNVISNGKDLDDKRRLIIVARLSSVKGHDRLIDIFHTLPNNYLLTIAGGDGGVKKMIEGRIHQLNLQSRIKMIGEITDVCKVISEHSLFVLCSYTEGFPNVILESLSVGVPVVTFRVGGVSSFIINDFNGYIIEQGDNAMFKECIIKASNKLWDHEGIAKDIHNRFSITKIAQQYEQLLDD
jgi:glycosyltransferase involved in cell wall biosynthesis